MEEFKSFVKIDRDSLLKYMKELKAGKGTL